MFGLHIILKLDLISMCLLQKGEHELKNNFIITRDVIEECLKECLEDTENSNEEKTNSVNKK